MTTFDLAKTPVFTTLRMYCGVTHTCNVTVNTLYYLPIALLEFYRQLTCYWCIGIITTGALRYSNKPLLILVYITNTMHEEYYYKE